MIVGLHKLGERHLEKEFYKLNSLWWLYYICVFRFFLKILANYKMVNTSCVFSYIGKDHLFLRKEGTLFSRKMRKKHGL